MTTQSAQPITIVIPIYPGVTHLDFTGPHQFFTRLGNARVVVASVGAAPIVADGLTFAGLADLTEIERCDLLCVPGGAGCANAMTDPDFLAALRRLAATARFVTSVCTGSLILGAAGLLTGKRAACHWAWRDLLEPFGAIPDSGRIVRDGNVITGGGVTAGIDFAIAVIAELAGPVAAQSIQLGLEYAPEPPFASDRPETAPPEVVERVKAGMATLMPERRAAIHRAADALRAGAA